MGDLHVGGVDEGEVEDIGPFHLVVVELRLPDGVRAPVSLGGVIGQGQVNADDLAGKSV